VTSRLRSWAVSFAALVAFSGLAACGADPVGRVGDPDDPPGADDQAFSCLVRCGSDAACPSEQVCDDQTGTCVALARCQDDDLDEALECPGGACDAGTCVSSASCEVVGCPAGFECSVDGTCDCTLGAPADANDCAADPRGALCLAGGDCGCATDADCGSSDRGTVCVDGTCGCRGDGTCADDGACAAPPVFDAADFDRCEERLDEGDGGCDCGCGSPDPDCGGDGCLAPGCETKACERCYAGNGPDRPCGGIDVVEIALGGNHACVVLETGDVKCWGENDDGALGIGSEATDIRGDDAAEMGDALPVVSLGTGRTASSLAVGRAFACAVLEDARVKCWGANLFGQLGVGDDDARGTSIAQMGDTLPEVGFEEGVTVRSVAAGLTHACAVLGDNTLRCWGANATGQLGLGDTDPRGTEPGQLGPPIEVDVGGSVVAVAAGREHTCAIRSTRDLKCWGDNASGELGQDDDVARGDDLGEMGFALDPVPLGGLDVLAVSAGDDFTCAILENGRVLCWGRNQNGQLGLGSDDDAIGNADGDMASLSFVELGTDDEGEPMRATVITSGGAHTCVILEDGSVRCWGRNSSGQLGLDDDEDRGDDPLEMGDFLDLVDLGEGLSGERRTAKRIAAGDAHTCAVLDDNQVKCWGRNQTGQLGLGLAADDFRGDELGEMATLPTVELGTNP
jgi:alpha-tubulin suppressor-like RCC1 family protein